MNDITVDRKIGKENFPLDLEKKGYYWIVYHENCRWINNKKLSVYCVLSTVLTASHAFSHLILKMTLWSCNYFHINSKH